MSTAISEVSNNHIQHALLIRLTIDGTVYRLATTYKSVTYNSETYIPQGNLLSVSEIKDELKNSNNDISIVISGVPTDPNYLAIVLASNIKGSRVELIRAFFNPDTQELQGTYLRYKGYINNYSITDSQEQFSKDASTSIVVSCSSINNILENKVMGRRTNKVDHQRYFPTDVSMNRVATLYNTAFDFGKPYTAPTNATGNNSTSNTTTETFQGY